MIQDVKDSLISAERTEAGVSARFRFAPELRVFEGHFPGYPLVPAVFQLAAVQVAVGHCLGRTLRIGEVVDSKFKAELLPGQDLELDVTVTEVEQILHCKASLTAAHGTIAILKLKLVDA